MKVQVQEVKGQGHRMT